MKDYEVINLKVGVMYKYNAGSVVVYNYKTNDALEDQVILVQDKENLVSIEGPLFNANVDELNEFVDSLNVKNKVIILVDHVAPINYLKGSKVLTTTYNLPNLVNGAPKALYTNFTNIFKDAVAQTINENYEVIEGDSYSLGDIKLNFIRQGDEFDVEITNLNSVYTHMFGEKVHNIVPGVEAVNALLSKCHDFKTKGYEIIFTSHLVPETSEVIDTKISYLEDLKVIAKASTSKAEFIEKVKAKYSSYSGENYLEMSASGFFAE